MSNDINQSDKENSNPFSLKKLGEILLDFLNEDTDMSVSDNVVNLNSDSESDSDSESGSVKTIKPTTNPSSQVPLSVHEGSTSLSSEGSVDSGLAQSTPSSSSVNPEIPLAVDEYIHGIRDKMEDLNYSLTKQRDKVTPDTLKK